MRRPPVLALVAATVAALAALGLSPAAHAGGPTSVLLTRPGDSAAALYHTDSRYAALQDLLAGAGEEVAAPSGLGNGGQAYNLTWLIHDQLVWRTDRVHVHDGVVHVETTVVDGVVDPAEPGTTTWHRVARGEELLGLLRGLLAGGADGPDRGQPSEAVVPASRESSAPVAGPSATTGWWWALPGLLLGTVLGAVVAVGGPGARRHGSAPREPRRVLVDSGPRGT